MTLKNRIEQCLTEMNTPDLVEIWNRYVENIRRNELHIYPMRKFNEVFNGDAEKAIACCNFSMRDGNFSLNDNYFWFLSDGYVESANYPNENNSIVSYCDLANHIFNHNNPLGNLEIEKIIGMERRSYEVTCKISIRVSALDEDEAQEIALDNIACGDIKDCDVMEIKQ